MNDTPDTQDAKPTLSGEEPVTLAYARAEPLRTSLLVYALLGATAATVAVWIGEAVAIGLSALVAPALVLLGPKDGRKGRAVVCAVGGWTVPLLIVLAIPAQRRSPRTISPHILCATRLKGIGHAIAVYRMDNANAYPPDLHALIAAPYLDAKDLECPVDATLGGPDYFYIRPAWAGDPTPPPEATTILACDFRSNHPGWRSVLFRGERIKRLDEADFQVLLKRPENAAFAAALRGAEGP